jgi:hypothetical protein
MPLLLRRLGCRLGSRLGRRLSRGLSSSLLGLERLFGSSVLRVGGLLATLLARVNFAGAGSLCLQLLVHPGDDAVTSLAGLAQLETIKVVQLCSLWTK